jgi:hypothetical protein
VIELHLSGMKARNGTLVFVCSTCNVPPNFSLNIVAEGKPRPTCPGKGYRRMPSTALRHEPTSLWLRSRLQKLWLLRATGHGWNACGRALGASGVRALLVCRQFLFPHNTYRLYWDTNVLRESQSPLDCSHEG